ncbi:peptide ABC transporter substrate-binding protein [Anaerocolumna sp.]|uniref:peptide ABC transporter substrate-binding protein n=1 Tax=Anaerocolumna sp. TaxID=2041569 RepID=UPI0028A897B2|nr:peptide ABC transporter substrate-binding protein [Anaerocolumna sp.]
MKKKIISLLLCLTFVTTAFAACGKKKGASDEVVYRKLYAGEVTTMNYLVTVSETEFDVGANVIDTLVEYDNLGQIQPSLAESWEMSPDGLTYTFKIREGQKWYDYQGKEVAEVTAEDFVSAMKFVLTPEYESGTAQLLFGVIKNAEEYFNSQVEDNPETEEVEGNDLNIDFSEVGVKALDKYTLEYTLTHPVPYFLSSLTYVCYMPAYGPLLEELGAEFGSDNTKMYYNGAYILSEFAPQETKIYVKNKNNWDAEHIYIDKIVERYNAEANTLAPQMVQTGEMDYATIESNIVDDWLADPERAKLISKSRVEVDYSYFYSFNFNPQFDKQYEPDNWRMAVNNENFRQSLKAGLDRVRALSVTEPETPEVLLINTITPETFVTNEGKDYTSYGDLDAINNGNSFDEKAALSYKEAAVSELTAAGVTFPIKILMPYNPGNSGNADWGNECVVIEQQLENLLGKDYIDIIVEAGPSTNFLSEVRRSGKYAFMKTNWGADYADPQTFTDPFTADNSYNFMDKALAAGEGVADTAAEYYALVDAAKAIMIDLEARYDAFAKAEAYLIEHALVVPYAVSGSYYQITKKDIYEGQYAPFGVSVLRHKGQHLLDKPVTMEEFQASQDQWNKDREALAK